MKSLWETFRETEKSWNDEYRDFMEYYDSEKKTIETEIDLLKNRLNQLEDKRVELCNTRVTQHDYIKMLARNLAKHYGLSYEIYGPFGLNAQTTIYLIEKPHKPITEQDTISITVRPYDTKDNVVTYWTGDVDNRYEPGSLGDLNGYNLVFAPLPETLDEIVRKCMRYSSKH